MVRCRAYRRREYGGHLDLRWKQADDLDARHVHQFAQLLEAELDIALGHERAYGNTRRSLHDVRRDGLGDAPALEQADNVRAARTGRIADAAGAQDGVAKRRLAGDVGSLRARGHRDRHGGTSEIRSTLGVDTTRGCQALDRIVRQHDEVERLTV